MRVRGEEEACCGGGVCLVVEILDKVVGEHHFTENMTFGSRPERPRELSLSDSPALVVTERLEAGASRQSKWAVCSQMWVLTCTSVSKGDSCWWKADEKYDLTDSGYCVKTDCGEQEREQLKCYYCKLGWELVVSGKRRITGKWWDGSRLDTFEMWSPVELLMDGVTSRLASCFQPCTSCTFLSICLFSEPSQPWGEGWISSLLHPSSAGPEAHLLVKPLTVLSCVHQLSELYDCLVPILFPYRFSP